MTEMTRCSWVKMSNPLYVAYHDEEWGKAVHDDRTLFELFCLETYQAGLSWETILNKRQAFGRAFYHYDMDRVAAMTDQELEALLEDASIVRHRGKIWATRTNARALKEIQAEFGSLDAYFWSWVDGVTQVHSVTDYRQMPAQTDLSRALAKDLKKRGTSFAGPTAMQSFLQAAGMFNDHEDSCSFK